MASEDETNEDTYNAHIEALREEIQSLLDTNQVEEAKVMQEKRPWWKRSTVLTRHGLLTFALNSSQLFWE